MAGDLTEQTTRAQKWLAGAKWKLRESRDFRPRADIQVVERFLEEVPRELLRGLVAYLVATATEADPQIEGKPYFGTWTFSKHSWERGGPDDDNKLTFVQTMTAGAGATAGYVVENGCAAVVTQTFYWDVAALPSVPEGTSGTEYRLAGISRSREDGLYNCWIEKRERVTQTIAQYVSEEGSAERTLEQSFLGVWTGDVDHAGDAVGLQSMTLEAGKIKVRRRRKNADCTQDVEEQDRRSVNQTATDYAKGHAEDVEEAKHTQGDALAEPLSPAAGTLTELEQEPTIFGKLRTRLRTRTAKNQTAASWQKSHAETVAEALATQDSAGTEPGAPAAGTVTELDQEPTIFGLFRKRARTRTAVNQTATDWQKGHAEDVSEAKATQGAAETEPASPSAGTITEVVQDPTIFGWFRKAVRTRTAKNQTAASWRKSHAETTAEALATQDGAGTEPGAPGAGTVTELDQEPTIFGLFRKRARTRTAINQTATAGETRADQTSATATATQADAEVSAAAGLGEAGKVIRARNRATEFGKVATEREVVTPVAQAWTGSIASKRGKRSGTLTVWRWRNQASGYGADIAFTAGASTELSAGLNEFGLEDGSASQWVDTGGSTWETDAVPVGLQTWEGSFDRVKDTVAADGTITTKKQTVTFNFYMEYCGTASNAKTAVEDMPNLASYAQRLVTLRSGERRYLVTGKSKPTAYGAWTTV